MCRGNRIGAIAVFVITAAHIGPTAALDRYSGDVGFRYGVWKSDRSLTDLTSVNVVTTVVKVRAALSPESRLHIDGIATAERTSGTPVSDRSEIREAMFTHEIGPTELRLGWQTFAWGRADRINPTDVLTPKNYQLLVPEDDEQRIGAPALSLNLGLGESWRLIGIAQHFVRSRLPSDDQEAGLAQIDRGRSMEWAAKLDRMGEGIDWSLSYFNGREKNRVLILANCLETTPTAVREHPAIQMLGSDLATTVGGYGIRAELARVDVREGEAATCGGRSSYTSTVIGVDHNLPGDATAGIQWFVKRYDDELLPPSTLTAALRPSLAQFQAINGQISRIQPGITLRYGQRFLNDQLSMELVVVYNYKTRDSAIRPRLTYRMTDRLRLVGGADKFRGDDSSSFGLIKRNSGVFIQLHMDLL